MKHIFLINPAAGKGKYCEQLIKNIKEICEEKNKDYEIYTTKNVGDARVYAARRCAELGAPCRFYSCGGDGTLNEVVNGIVEYPFAEAAVIPIGTGNDFVKNFSHPEKFMDIEAQLEGEPIKLDLIKYNDSYCVNMINIGFDCEVVKKVAQIKKNPLVPGKFAYLAGAFAELIKKPGAEFISETDEGFGENKKLLLAAIANGRFCGGGFLSNPQAYANDGLMDICFVKYISRLRFISLFGVYKKGQHLEKNSAKDVIDYIKCKKLKIEFGRPHSICVDGEIEESTALSIELKKGIFNLSLPRGVIYAHGESCDGSESIKEPVSV
jgi:YegS/Rv2252/BmrU family lipid kinase